MDRRLVLLGAAAAPLVAPALIRSASAAMGDAEKTYATKTAMAGNASLMMADVALQKAHGAKVKEFAQFEHDEQTTIADIIKSMNPGMTPPAPDAKAAAAIDKLKSSSGAAFDRAFVAGQIDGHEQLLAIQEEYLKSGSDRETMNVAKLARGQIKEHLTLLSDLKKMA